MELIFQCHNLVGNVIGLEQNRLTPNEELQLVEELEACLLTIQTQENSLSELTNRLQEAETEYSILQEKLKELNSTIQEHRKEIHLEEIAQTKITQQMQSLQRQTV